MITPNRQITAMTVRGSSMMPFLHDGETVLVRNVELPLTPGKCYGFGGDDGLIIHRFVKKHDNASAIFMADNSSNVETVLISKIMFELLKDERVLKLAFVTTINLISAVLIGSRFVMMIRRAVFKLLVLLT